MGPDARRPVRGVVFDLDGTLVDSYGPIARSLNHARDAFGLAPLPEDEVRRSVGRGLEVLMADLLGPDRVDEGVRLFRERYAEVYRDGTTALPGVVDAVTELHARGLRMAVASNKPARFSVPILESVGLSPYIGIVEGPDSAGRTKPDPAMIYACLGRMGLGADETLYVGDMVLDVESGRNAGLDVVLVGGGSSSDASLRATGQPLIGGVAELPAMLHARSSSSGP